MSDIDLLVVGFGPVGATLAGLAAQHGLSVLVVERDTEIYPLPRAVQCDHEVLRILQQLAIADEVLAASVSNEGLDFLGADRTPLLSFTVPALAPTGWPTSIFFHQPTFEATLRRRVRELDVEVRLGTEVIAVDIDAAGGATALLSDGSRVDAPFVAACDGARSGVRKALGIAMRDSDFEEPWLVIDLHLSPDAPTLATRCLQVCDPARPHTLVPMPGNRFRFEFMLLPGETAEDVQRPEVIDRLLSAWIDPALVEIERAAVYTFHGLVAAQWRHGPVFLVGDAAHQTPPFLGQGMCAGMRDAANLAWKLAAVHRDGAPGRLLDTYQAEREPHAQHVIDAAVSFGRMICLRDADEAADRDAALRAHQPDTDDVPDLFPPLTAGPLVGLDGGDLAAQPCLEGIRLDDLVGVRWLVVTAEPLEAAPAEGRDRTDVVDEVSWWGERALLLDATTRRALTPLLGGHEAVAVRPDRYVAARGTLAEVTTFVAAGLGIERAASNR